MCGRTGHIYFGLVYLTRLRTSSLGELLEAPIGGIRIAGFPFVVPWRFAGMNDPTGLLKGLVRRLLTTTRPKST